MELHFYNVKRNSGLLLFARIIIIVTLVILIHGFVYHTGGTSSAFPQLCYIPIVLSAYYWGKWGGASVGLITGLLMGPLMPKDADQKIMQDPANWILRLIIFVLVGYVVGLIIEKVNRATKEKIERERINPLTNLPNVNALVNEINVKIKENKSIVVVIFTFKNLSEVSKYVSYHVVGDAVLHLCDKIVNSIGHEQVYALTDSEYVVLVDSDQKDEILTTAQDLLEEFYYHPLEVNEYIFKIFIQAGYYQTKPDDQDPFDVIAKARTASDQGNQNGNYVKQYDEKFAAMNRLTNEIAGSILKAIEKDELYLVYQPKIHLKEKRISGVEVLVRWDRGERPPIGPNIFVPVAENIGYITEISRWIISTGLHQVQEWEKQGIKINLAINFTTREVADDTLKVYALNLIEAYGFEQSRFEIEITERVFAEDKKKAIDTLSAARALGFKVSIDDYGTGYNSLMSAVEIPFDSIKIDKYFIDRLDQNEIRQMVKSIIDYVHGLGKEVIAEGVETKEQLDILARLECDKIQGYYFCKPLLAADFKDYYMNFSFDDYQ